MLQDPVLFESLKSHMIILRGNVSNLVNLASLTGTNLTLLTDLSGLLQMDHIWPDHPAREIMG